MPFFFVSFHPSPLFYVHMYLCCSLLPVSLFVETFKGLGVTADVGVPSTTPPATPIALVSVAPYVPVSILSTAPIITGPGECPFPSSHSSFLLCKSVLF